MIYDPAADGVCAEQPGYAEFSHASFGYAGLIALETPSTLPEASLARAAT